MLRATALRLPKAGYDEITHKARRVCLRPQMHTTRADKRLRVYQLRFKEVGPAFSKVWLSLGGKMRRRRIGRTRDFKDLRYYWRPIEPQYQRLYQSRLRKADHSNPLAGPLPMRATNFEVGLTTSRPEFQKAFFRKYGSSAAPPRPLDFEFRVF
jgi:hypothetical protein